MIVLAVGTQAFLSYWLSLWTDAGSAVNMQLLNLTSRFNQIILRVT